MSRDLQGIALLGITFVLLLMWALSGVDATPPANIERLPILTPMITETP